jgi:hypothetical protein
MQSKLQLLLMILSCLTLGFSCKQQQIQPWLLLKTNDGEFGYLDYAGDTMIAAGKYSICFTDTFETFGIVFDENLGIIGINKAEEKLFNVFSYDNGPDYLSEGLFRIIIDDKIGYADEKGKIVISPTFMCAYLFQNGKARVSFSCSKVADGEHSTWESEDWFYIDKNGKIVQ